MRKPKGLLWLAFTVKTPGAHGAYTHVSPSATKIAARLIVELEALCDIQMPAPEQVETVLRRNAEFIDQAQGEGAAETLRKITVNIGVIEGGLKVNMVPGTCALQVDIRIPIGLDKESVMTEVQKIVSRHPEVSAEIVGVQKVIFLRLKDGELENNREFRKTLVCELRQYRPDVVLTMDPANVRFENVYVSHADHRAAVLAAFDAIYPEARNRNFFPSSWKRDCYRIQ